MKERPNDTYYEYIMGNSELSLRCIFHKEWISYLDSLEVPYKNALQLKIGNHLRPLLVYWGCAMGAKSIEEMDISVATELAICVEMMHKTSIIVDDLIDSDDMRHHESSFHHQYSPEKTIIFAIYMLGKAIEKMNHIPACTTELHTQHLDLYAKTLSRMAMGCLRELDLTQETCFNLEEIIAIIFMETSTLIKNSFLLGFLTNDNPSSELYKIGEDVGDKVGYLFQVLNDLEPFCSRENITHHKGKLNADFNRSRKNIVMAYIYGACTSKEKKQLEGIQDASKSIDFIFALFQKYSIIDLINQDLKKTERQIDLLLGELSKYNISTDCLHDFRKFFADTMAIGRAKLNNVDQTPID